MTPADTFRHCPACGRPTDTVGQTPFVCDGCNYVLYFNPTVAAAAFVFDPHGRVILIRRAKEPAKGKLTVPGGFVDAGETAEAALVREIQEEVGLEVTDVRFVASFPNRYPYKGITYNVCDLMFRATAVNPADAAALDGAESFGWYTLAEIDPDELAFPAVRGGLSLLMSNAE